MKTVKNTQNVRSSNSVKKISVTPSRNGRPIPSRRMTRSRKRTGLSINQTIENHKSNTIKKIRGQVDKNEAIALDSSSDEEPKSQEKCKNLPKNMESSPLILLNQMKTQYASLLCKYKALQEEKLEHMSAVFVKQQNRISSFTEASQKLVDFHKEEAERIMSLAEAADLMNLVEENKQLEKENGNLQVMLTEQKLENYKLEAKCTLLTAQYEDLCSKLKEVEQNRVDSKILRSRMAASPLSPIAEDSKEEGENEGRNLNNGTVNSEKEDEMDMSLVAGDQVSHLRSFQESNKILSDEKSPRKGTETQVSLGSSQNADKISDKESQGSLFSQNGFMGLMEKAEVMEDESQVCLSEWQERFAAIPGVTTQIECPMTGTNSVTVTFTQERTGFKFQLGPVPRVEVEVKTPFSRDVDFSEDEEFYLRCISTGNLDNLPPFLDEDDDDGILISSSEAGKCFLELEKILSKNL